MLSFGLYIYRSIYFCIFLFSLQICLSDKLTHLIFLYRNLFLLQTISNRSFAIFSGVELLMEIPLHRPLGFRYSTRSFHFLNKQTYYPFYFDLVIFSPIFLWFLLIGKVNRWLDRSDWVSFVMYFLFLLEQEQQKAFAVFV